MDDGVRHIPWPEANAELTKLALKRAACLVLGEDTEPFHFDRQQDVIRARMRGQSVLAQMAARFGLDAIATDVLAIVALSDQTPKLSATLDENQYSVEGRATPALLQDCLGEDALTAISPAAPLVQSGLLHIGDGGRRFDRPITLCMPALEALDGRIAFDPAWSDLIQPQPEMTTQAPDEGLALTLRRALLAARQVGGARVFHAPDGIPRVAATLAIISEALDWPMVHISVSDLPDAGPERATLLKYMRRDFILTGALPVLHVDDRDMAVATVARALPGPVVMLGGAIEAGTAADVATIHAPEQNHTPLAIWTELFGEDQAESFCAPDVAETFNLSPARARRAARSVQFGLAPDLWQAARVQAREDIGALAQKLDRLCQWDDLVLPHAQSEALEQMAQFLMNRHKVNAGWGFGRKSARGLGMAALFYGDSGTGKTSAAEALVGRMRDQQGAPISLYRVNTAALVSKYIGETSKNFARIFEAGRASGAALLFDEAEGLFGKRSSQNRDSIDKHANAELGFLLQCLESYPGIAILTTNMRQAIDSAFFRRFRFAIEFPFPDRADRKAIWQRVIPPQMPCDALDFEGLSALPLSGGSIRSTVLNAAFMAAGDGTDRVTMRHVTQALRLEFAKLEKALPERMLAGLEQ